MSFMQPEPRPGDVITGDAVARLIVPRSVDLGGFRIRRALPSAQTRMVGPFIFFDHFGPARLTPGQGFDVRPHPHIGLATLTYLYEGEIHHRDSLGTHAVIRPGEVNLMTAGRGIAHSERTSPERRAAGGPVHGLQCWLALPQTREEMEPAFAHYAEGRFPQVDIGGNAVRTVVGASFGLAAPVVTEWPALFVDIRLTPAVALPIDPDHEERAIYVVDGEIEIAGDRFGPDRLLVLRPGDRLSVRAASATAHVVLLGGAPMDGPRHIWWNFVSSRRERIEAAKADWRDRRFAPVPGDDVEFIALPT